MIFSEEFKNEFKEIIKIAVREELTVLLDNNPLNVPAADEMLNIRQAAIFLDRPISSLYTLVSKKLIPFNKPGKRLYFMKSELIQWVRSGRKKTKDELLIDFDSMLTAKKCA